MKKGDEQARRPSHVKKKHSSGKTIILRPILSLYITLYCSIQSGLSPAQEDKVVPLPPGHVLTTCSWEKQEFDSWPILLFSTFNSPFGEAIRFSTAASLESFFFFFFKKPSLITKWRNSVAFPPPLTVPAFEISIWSACVWFKLLCLSSCPHRMWKHLWKGKAHPGAHAQIT